MAHLHDTGYKYLFSHADLVRELLKAIALEEGVPVVGMTDVLAFAEKAGIIESEQDWKEPRDVRNAINHEYEEDAATLSALATRMLELVAPLLRMNERAACYCAKKLGIAAAIQSGA
jgi:predicted nucleic acid-binding protein